MAAVCNSIFRCFFVLLILTQCTTVEVKSNKQFHIKPFGPDMNPQEIFLTRHLTRFKNQNVCLVTNQAGLGRYLLKPARKLQNGKISFLQEMFLEHQISLTKVFTPEHGLFGLEDLKGTDDKTLNRDLPMAAIYNESVKSLEAKITDCRLILYDLPDSGVRPYTYRVIMTRMMQALQNASGKSSESDILKLVIIDSPNPASQYGLHGPMASSKLFSEIGEQSIPFYPRYTQGELARLYHGQNKFSFAIEVVALEQYDPGENFLSSGRRLSFPSPNLPDFFAVACYWVSVWLEATLIHEGRDTKDPFCTIGHPDLDYSKDPPRGEGSYWREFRYRPADGSFKHQWLYGYRLEITDWQKFNPFKTAYELLLFIHQNRPDIPLFKKWHGKYFAMDELCGCRSMRQALEQNLSFNAFAASLEADLKDFQRQMRPFLLYSYSE